MGIQNLPDFPTSAFGATGGLNLNKDPLVCGGLLGMDNNSNLYSSQCYSFEAQGWNASYYLTMPKAFSAIASNENGEWFISGGLSNDTSSNSTTELLTQDGWRPVLGDLPVKVNRHCMAFINSSTLIVIGGSQTNFVYSSHTFVFDMNNKSR